MQAPTFDSIEFNFNDYGMSIYHYVRGCWMVTVIVDRSHG
ncbi:hypothetical protein VIAG107301_10940 [Vibrio agarivorans]